MVGLVTGWGIILLCKNSVSTLAAKKCVILISTFYATILLKPLPLIFDTELKMAHQFHNTHA